MSARKPANPRGEARAATSTQSDPRPSAEDAAAEIDARIAELGDWRGRALARVRGLILKADPGVTEDVKWRKPSNAMAGVPVWSGPGGIICTGETYKDKVKLTFAKGASLDDPAGLFNASLDGGTRRAIDLFEGDQVDAKALAALVRAAIALGTPSKTVQPRAGTVRRSKRPKP